MSRPVEVTSIYILISIVVLCSGKNGHACSRSVRLLIKSINRGPFPGRPDAAFDHETASEADMTKIYSFRNPLQHIDISKLRTSGTAVAVNCRCSSSDGG
jgi:hypothetical protein